MKKYFTLLLLVIAFQGFSQTYPITGISISLPSSPDANTANWKSGTSLLTITATTLADNGRIAPNVIASKILVTIKKGGVKAYGDYTINSAPSSDFNTPSKIYRGDSAVSFIGKSFILAPGDYEICVQFYSIGAAGPTPISGEKTKAFSIIAQTYPITSISISLPSSPDANTANWKSGTSLLTITATTLVDNGSIAPNVIASKILVTIKKGGVKAYGDYTINSAPSSDFNTPSKIYRGDSAVSFIGKSFILAPGDYEICVQFYSNGAAGPVPISEEKTKAFSIVAQTYPITGISILLPSSPDANTANWKSGTSLLIISATTLAENGRIASNVLTSKILVTIKKGGVKAYGDYTINSAPSSDFNTPSKIYKGDSAVSFIGKSFILAPGDYMICVQFFGDGVAGPTPISEEKTKAFSISADVPVYQAPQIIAPSDGTVFIETELQKPIIFSWTSVAPKPPDPVNYRLMVWQLMQGQTGVEAMKVNQPIIIKDVDNITQVSINSIVDGPCLPPYMCDFIWNVQALNQEGKPIGENNGESIPGGFQIKYESGQIGDITTNMCDNFNFELRKIYKGDSISYACILTNKYTGKDLGYVPKSFSIEIKNNLVIAVDDYAPKEWDRTPSKFPPGSSQIKWTNNSGDIPQGESNLGAIHFGVPTANPFYVVYEWINSDEKVICKDSIALIDSNYYYELVKEPSNTYFEISDTILRVQFFNQYASNDSIKIRIYDVEAQAIKRKSKDVIKLNSVAGLNRISIDIKDYNLEPDRLYLLTVSDLNNTYYLNFKVTNDREKFDDVTGPTLEIKAPISPISNVFTIGLKFSEPVTGVLAGVTVTGGKVEIYPLVGGKEYNLLISANKQTLVTVVLSDMIIDLSANSNKFIGKTLTYTTGDFTHPQLVTWSPTDGETITGNQPTLKMTFNMVVVVGDPAAKINVYKQASTGNSLVFSTAITSKNLSADGKTVSVTTTALEDLTSYFVLVDRGLVKDEAGNDFAGITDNRGTFVVGDFTGPTVVVTPPASPVATVFTVDLKFNEAVSGVADGITASGGKIDKIAATVVGGKPDVTGTAYTLTVSAVEQTNVTITLTDAIKDVSLSTNAFAGMVLNYTTGDFTHPMLVSWSPTDGATTVDNNPTYKMTFSESVVVGTGGSLRICKVNKTTTVLEIPITADMISGKYVNVSFTGTTNGLDKDTRYYVLVDGTALKDNAGNAFDGVSDPAAWTFKTGPFATVIDPIANGSLEFKVYPNPFVEYINIDNALKLSKVIVTNIAGQVVKEVVNPTNSIQLNKLQNGVYFISLYKTDHLIPENFKIVKR